MSQCCVVCEVVAISLQVYENFLEEIDAVDNGINQYDGTARCV